MTDLEPIFDAAKRGDVDAIQTILQRSPELATQRDNTGATALHYAALNGHRDVVRALVSAGADVNAVDGKVGATPAGWAIEYLRELGALLAIELDDLTYAIRRGDVDWVSRFVRRHPALRDARDNSGKSFKTIAEECGSREIGALLR